MIDNDCKKNSTFAIADDKNFLKSLIKYMIQYQKALNIGNEAKL